MKFCDEKIVWLVTIYFQFNSLSIQVEGSQVSYNNGSINQNFTKTDRSFAVFDTKNFLFYKSSVIYERSCTCEMEISCSCCESVVLLFTKSLGKLCGNLMYRPDGFNVNITLDGNTIRSMSVTNYHPLKICALIPKSLFSIVCLNILELNLFPRSVTACPRLEIATKNQNWKINYTCVSISTMGSEIESAVIANPNRLTSVGMMTLLNTLGNRTVLIQNVSPPKQTQSQLSAMTPGVVNLPSLNMSTAKITSATPKTPTSSIKTVMQPLTTSGTPSISPNTPSRLNTITSSTTLSTPVSSQIIPVSSQIIPVSSQIIPVITSNQRTSNKWPTGFKTQTSFRSFSIIPATTISPKDVTVFSSTFSSFQKSKTKLKNTVPMSSHQKPITTTTSINLKSTLVKLSTSFTTNNSSLETASVPVGTETTTAISKTSVRSQNTSMSSSVSIGSQKFLETSTTQNPETSTVPIIVTEIYSDLSPEQLNSDETTNLSTYSEPLSSDTEIMTDEILETTIKMAVTEPTMYTTSQHHYQTVEIMESDHTVNFSETSTVA